MKTLSQVLDNLPTNAGAENSAGLPTPQPGSTPVAGIHDLGTIIGAILILGWFLHRLGTVIYWWLD
jgi:hypothetical protein